MDKSALDQWLDLAPKPWPLRPDQKWHAYLSYRSTHRAWVLQLYDILKGLHYQTFLDQYVLTAGTSLVGSLQESAREQCFGDTRLGIEHRQLGLDPA